MGELCVGAQVLPHYAESCQGTLQIAYMTLQATIVSLPGAVAKDKAELSSGLICGGCSN